MNKKRKYNITKEMVGQDQPQTGALLVTITKEYFSSRQMWEY